MARRLDLTGQPFGRLVALEPTSRRENGSVVWKCRCECGAIHFARADKLRRLEVVSCGCKSRQEAWAERYPDHTEDLTGRQLGSWTVEEDTGRRSKKGIIMWRCRCICGRVKAVRADNLLAGLSTSCGCSRRRQ
jgi:hypothetical protein